MAKGKVKREANLDRKFGASESYLFVKIEAAWSSQREEYLLLTDSEVREASSRAHKNSDDFPSDLSLGVFTRVDNSKRLASADGYYLSFRVLHDGHEVPLMFTEEEMDRVRLRVEKNQEDIEANKTGWLADLFD